MNILVTGGAGFIGSNFIHEAHSLGHSIVNLDKLTYAGNLENLKDIKDNYEFLRWDITRFDSLTSIMEAHDIEVIVHFAAESHVDRSIKGPKEFFDTNIVGTANLVEAVRQLKGIQEILFIHVSTDEVFGSLGETGLFNEQTPYDPRSPYAASKASSDMIVRSYYHTYKIPCIITNCSNNYGPYQFPEKLIPLLINNIIHKEKLPVYGDGKNVRDWLYVRDHCKAILKVIESGRIGESYCIGGNNEWTNIDIVELVCEIMQEFVGYDATTNIEFVEDRKGHDWRYAIDAYKMEREFGWEPQEKFVTGIRKTIEWYVNNQDWLENVTSGAYKDYYEKMYGKKI